jgi:hypothetical protein
MVGSLKGLFRRPIHCAVAHSRKKSSSSRPRKSFYAVCFIVVVIAAAEIRALLTAVASKSLKVNESTSLHDAAITDLILHDVDIQDHVASVGPLVEEKPVERCAINFFGLPRAFESLVLPSIVKHIIEPNLDCDYFVHYYHMTEEAAGRSGHGGTINPTEVLLLRQSVLRVAASRQESRTPMVEFVFDTEENFWSKYTSLVEKIRNTKVRGRYLYFPWKAHTYKHPVTTDNIVKMWHSIQSVHELMERSAAAHNIKYTTVAMLRSDVVYVTPINVRDGSSDNSVVTIPDFGNHPVSDRIAYGSAEGVKIWATTRFSSLEAHVRYVQKHDPGWGMHSERYMNTTVFPAITKLGISIRKHPTLCFVRARADETVWITDCAGLPSVSNPSIMKALSGNMRAALARAIGRPCTGKMVKLNLSVKSLDCSQRK